MKNYINYTTSNDMCPDRSKNTSISHVYKNMSPLKNKFYVIECITT